MVSDKRALAIIDELRSRGATQVVVHVDDVRIQADGLLPIVKSAPVVDREDIIEAERQRKLARDEERKREEKILFGE